MRGREIDTERERGGERYNEREIQRERYGGGRDTERERDTMRERERFNESERGERDIWTDRQIDVQMTYVTPHFHFENSFEWK